MKCDWTNYDEDCKYCFDIHCTLPPSDLDSRPNDAECKKEIEYEYRKYASRQVKKLERDYR